MKKIFALILAPVVLLLILMSAGSDHAASPTEEQNTSRVANMQAHQASKTLHLPGETTAIEQSVAVRTSPTLQKEAATQASNLYLDEASEWEDASGTTPPDTLIDYAMSLMGSPYVYGGTDETGFDCSGFTSHVYQAFGVPVTRSSSTQSEDGVEIDRAEAQPGDLLIFTGTNPNKREPGHVGIVISEPGDTISFVHSSSNGGVKVSQVEGSGYERRLLGVRRVL
jgi:cell wall-associated NlpC family hydrolase